MICLLNSEPLSLQGLLKMTLLQRLRYILEVWQPPGPVVLHIIDILIRIARHSKQAAYEVVFIYVSLQFEQDHHPKQYARMNVYKYVLHHYIKLGGCPFNGPLSGTKYPTRAASPIQNASTPKSSLPFSKHRSCALLCAGFSRTLHRVSYFVYF